MICKSAFLYDAGPCEENLRKQVDAFIKKKKAESKHVPLSVSVLVFDDVKVICGTQDGRACHATRNMASLMDVYSTYSESGSNVKLTRLFTSCSFCGMI